MPKCSNCFYGEWEYNEGVYYCHCFEYFLDEKTAECNELPCDGYVPDDRYNDTTEE